MLEGGIAQLSSGTWVAFAEEQGDKGPQVSTVLGKYGIQ